MKKKGKVTMIKILFGIFHLSVIGTTYDFPNVTHNLGFIQLTNHRGSLYQVNITTLFNKFHIELVTYNIVILFYK